jgi:hypothetical protein
MLLCMAPQCEGLAKRKTRKEAELLNVPPFLYRCPNTGEKVQAWASDDPEKGNLTYVQVTCLACAQAHLVNPKSGKVLGSADE